MPLIDTECLVIKSYNLAEADKIVLLLTREQGMVRAVAKGAKRLKSRFGSALEPFSILRVEYFEKESSELVSLQKTDLVKSNFEAASSPQFLQKFSYLAELLITFSPPRDPNEKLYRMVTACIDAAADSPDTLPAVGVYFEFWILQLAGFLPDWTRCNLCGHDFPDEQDTGISTNLHLHCISCRKPAAGATVHRDVRFIADASRRLSPRKFSETTNGHGTELSEFSSILRQIISRAIGKAGPTEKSLAPEN